MNKRRKTHLTNLISIVALFGIVCLVSATGILGNYFEGIMVLACINIVLAVSLNLTTGCLGQIALGHAGFMSVGAYTAAILSKIWSDNQYGSEYLGFGLSLLAGGILAGIFGLLIGIPALRLKGDYLAIITLGFGEIIRVLIENMSITGGAQGIFGIQKLSTLPVVAGIAILCVYLMFTMMWSRHGRAILSIREDDIASESSGIHNTYYKTLAFTTAAFFAGIAGGMFSHYITVIRATTFDFNKSIEILIIVVLGGLGSFTGSIIAALFLTLLPELLRNLNDYRMVTYALSLILIMIFKPSGVFGKYEISMTRSIQYWKEVIRRERVPFAAGINQCKVIARYWREVSDGERVPFAAVVIPVKAFFKRKKSSDSDNTGGTAK